MLQTGVAHVLLSPLIALITCLPGTAFAETPATSDRKIPFKYENAELTQMLQAYSKATGQKFVIDPGVRGKATILVQSDVTTTEAFNLLSSALAANGFAIVENGDAMEVMAARRVQRANHPVLTELPPLKPERMVTVVYTAKHISVDEINKRLRILPSRDGELTPFEETNKLIISDWVSNLHRIFKVLNEVDQPSKDAKM